MLEIKSEIKNVQVIHSPSPDLRGRTDQMRLNRNLAFDQEEIGFYSIFIWENLF